jgi:cation:H+ antiporter
VFGLSNLSLPLTIGIFAAAALAIAYFGQKLAAKADRLADVTGLGEAVAGAVLLGASTSLPGIITSASAAWRGYPELSVSNAVGGIAAQTVFLVAADVAYRKANLEYAAASAANIMQGTLLITLLAIPLVATTAPEIAFWGIHPASVLMLAIYGYGLHMVRQARTTPMWKPQETDKTETDEPDEDIDTGTGEARRLWLRFAMLAAIIAVAGWVIGRTGESIADRTGLSQTVVGGLLTAISTSLPELVTSIAAVRRGALTLAVSGIIGGNAFDTLFLAISDMAYREGSIFHAITQQQTFLMALTTLLTGILLMGLIRREERGIANIGFESFAILVLYIGAFVLLFMNGGSG